MVLQAPNSNLEAAASNITSVPEPIYARYIVVNNPETLQVLNAHVHGLSRKANIRPLVLISKNVARIDIRNYGWDAKIWENFLNVEPYFHLTIENEEFEDEVIEYGQWKDATGRVFDSGGPGRTWVKTRDVKTGKKVSKRTDKTRASFAATPQDQQAIKTLIEKTSSQIPIVRGDWFLVQTAAQVNRKGAGYYDFLQIKKRDDIDKLIGLDRAKAREIQKEMAAIVAESGVALNNRQIVRFQAIAGSYWQTLDAESSVKNNNALRLLDGDFKHDAEEIYFTLPNGLFGFAASAANGNLQDTVPDNIAHDKFSTSNDARIHPGIGCIRCHSPGLQPINDWARTFYSKDQTGAIIQLTSPDYEKAERLQQLYLSDLPTQLKRDNDDYAIALLKVNGLTPAANAKAFANVWKNYLDTPVTGEIFAQELNVDKKQMIEIFRKSNDPILLGFVRVPEYKAKREHIEEVFGVAMQLIYGDRK